MSALYSYSFKILISILLESGSGISSRLSQVIEKSGIYFVVLIQDARVFYSRNGSWLREEGLLIGL